MVQILNPVTTSSTLTQEVRDAYLKPRLVISRRLSIFEADGITPWSANDVQDRLVSGSVTVNSDQDERRTFECVLDNKDRGLKHDPDDGFWYDKIIKAYRGIVYQAKKRGRVVESNLAPNPSFTTTTGMGTGGSSTNAISSVWSMFGTTSLLNSPPATGGGSTACYPYGTTGAMAKMHMKKGRTYTVSVWCYLPQVQTGTLDTRSRSLDISYVNSAATPVTQFVYANSGSTPNVPGVYHLAVTFRVPDDASNMFIRLMNGSKISGEVIYFDGLMIVEGYGGTTYFDGDTTDTDDYEYTWNSDKSVSYMYEKVYQNYKYETQVGEFMIDNINTSRFPNQIVVTGRDYTKKLLLDQFAVDTAFAAGSKLDDIVRTVATNGGIKKFRLGSGGVIIGSTATFARTTSRWENLKSLCNSLNIEIYFDREGYLTTRPFQDISTAPPSFVLSKDESDANIIDFGKSSSDSNIFNHIVVIGTSEDETVTGYKYIAVMENRDPDSPTNIDRIGRRTFVYEVDYLTSQLDANNLCKRIFAVKQLEDFTLTFTSVCLPWLEAGRVVQFIDPDESETVPTRFLFSDFTIPLTLGPMTGSGKRIVIAGSEEEEGSPTVSIGMFNE
jgi:hypothetical protein